MDANPSGPEEEIVNWMLALFGFCFMLMAWKMTHISSTPMAGSRPAYPMPKTARIMFFIIGGVTFLFGVARLIGL